MSHHRLPSFEVIHVQEATASSDTALDATTAEHLGQKHLPSQRVRPRDVARASYNIDRVKSRQITELLDLWQRGDQQAGEALIEWLYPHLHRLAGSRLAEEPISLETTDLVHDAYLRLREQRAGWLSREQFFAIAARVVRRVIVDHLRTRNRVKRGGGWARVTLDRAQLAGIPKHADLLAIHQALEQLEAVDAEAVHIVEMRFFAGMTTDEVARALGTSPSTIGRRWRFARAWLGKHLAPSHET